MIPASLATGFALYCFDGRSGESNGSGVAYSREMADVGTTASAPISDLEGVSSRESSSTEASLKQSADDEARQANAMLPLSTRIFAGITTRAEVGDEVYDGIIRERAQELCAQFTEADQDDFCAKLMGFGNASAWDEFQKNQQPLEPGQDAIYGSLKSTAIAATEELAVAIGDSWAHGGFQEWSSKEGKPMGVDEWLLKHGKTRKDTAFFFTRSAGVGDRKFRSVFLSSDYPQLEELISYAKELRSELWHSQRGEDR